jgi:hypothetical protein
MRCTTGVRHRSSPPFAVRIFTAAAQATTRAKYSRAQKALQAYFQSERMPINVKCLFEGEGGSPISLLPI